jgi:hypothetical protein
LTLQNRYSLCSSDETLCLLEYYFVTGFCASILMVI